MVSPKDRTGRGKGRKRSEIPSLKIREKLPLTSPILYGRKFPTEVEKRDRIRRRCRTAMRRVLKRSLRTTVW